MSAEIHRDDLSQRPSRQVALRINDEVLPRLDPGDRLPTERELSARYGVGRTIIREAILILGLRDLVSTRRGSGSIKLKQSDVLAPADPPSSDEAIGPFELIQARLTLEGAVAGLAARVATATDLRRVKATLDEHVRLLSQPLTDMSFHGVMDIDRRFHLEIAEATHNLALIQTVGFVRNYVGTTEEWRVFLEVYERDRDQLDLALLEHRIILDRILERDAAGSQKAMRDHIYRKWDGLKNEFERQQIPLDTKMFSLDFDY